MREQGKAMKILGVGLSKTGTRSLHAALTLLGFRSIHWDTARLNDILEDSNPCPHFRRYDDIDAVTDVPAALFYRELLNAYPKAKAILTIRDVESWWKSIHFHFTVRFPLPPTMDLRQPWNMPKFRAVVRTLAYGSAMPKEYIFKKRFLEHNARARREIPAKRLLVLNIVAGEGWDKLCPFLGVPIPTVPFPHMNKTESEETAL
jgi:hypothetical protein